MSILQVVAKEWCGLALWRKCGVGRGAGLKGVVLCLGGGLELGWCDGEGGEGGVGKSDDGERTGGFGGVVEMSGGEEECVWSGMLRMT